MERCLLNKNFSQNMFVLFCFLFYYGAYHFFSINNFQALPLFNSDWDKARQKRQLKTAPLLLWFLGNNMRGRMHETGFLFLKNCASRIQTDPTKADFFLWIWRISLVIQTQWKIYVFETVRSCMDGDNPVINVKVCISMRLIKKE